jgi:hypothetical protein
VQKLLEMKDWVKQVFSPSPDAPPAIAAPTPEPGLTSVETKNGKL